MSIKRNYCYQRKDLIEKELSIPVGDESILFKRNQPIQYKRLKDDTFVIKYKGRWKEAESIDFDF